MKSLLFFFFSLANIDNRQLHDNLLSNYNKDILPNENNNPVYLKLGIALRAINNIDQIEGKLTTNIWLRYYWNDYNLRWNTGEYNTSELTFNTDPSLDSSIWTPDIYLYNTAEKPLENLDFSRAIVYNTGDIIWSRPGLLTSTCTFDLEKYPYDIQTCILKFGSWSYHKGLLNLSINSVDIDLSNYQLSDGWRIINRSSTYSEVLYACCPEIYPDIKFTLILQRKAGFYNVNIIGPTFATAVLMIVSLIIPWDSGERISFAVTVMLSIIVYLLILSDNLPKTDTIPLLSKMLVGLSVFSLVIVFFTVIITAMHSYVPDKNSKLVRILNKICELNCKARNTFNETFNRTDSYSDAIHSEPCIINNEDCKKFAKKIENWFTIVFFISFLIYSSIMLSQIPS